MRAQLSAEFLLVLAAALAAFSAMLPAIGSVKRASDEVLLMQDANLILDRISSAGLRSLISGRTAYAEIRSVSAFELSASGKRITLYSGNDSFSRGTGFSIVRSKISIGAGTSALAFTPSNGSVRVSVPDP